MAKGATPFGRLIPSQESLAQQALPIGLANGAIANRAIEQGELVRYGDVQLPAGRVTVKLREQLESEFQRTVIRTLPSVANRVRTHHCAVDLLAVELH